MYVVVVLQKQDHMAKAILESTFFHSAIHLPKYVPQQTLYFWGDMVIIYNI